MSEGHGGFYLTRCDPPRREGGTDGSMREETTECRKKPALACRPRLGLGVKFWAVNAWGRSVLAIVFPASIERVKRPTFSRKSK